MTLMHAEAVSNVAIYHTIYTPLKYVHIIDANRVIAIDNNYLMLLNPINGSIVYEYALFGVPIAFSTNRLFDAKYFAIATNHGEIIVFKTLNSSGVAKVSALRFHGVLRVLKLYVYRDLVYSLVESPPITKLIVLNATRTSWCEVGAPPSNMVTTKWSYVKLLDVIDALQPSNNTLASSSILIASYIRMSTLPPELLKNPVLLSVRVMIGNHSVANAIVEIKIGSILLHYITSPEGLVRTYVPRNASSIEIKAYFLNKTSGTTYFGKTVIQGPLPINVSSYYVVIHLKPQSVPIPQLYSRLTLSVINISDGDCSKLSTIMQIAFNVTNPKDIILLNAFIHRNNLIVVYGLKKKTFVGTLWSLNIMIVDLKTKSIIRNNVYFVSSKPIYAMISPDGSVICIVTESNILYVAWSPNLIGYRIVDSYVLPSTVTNIVIGKTLGSYIILVGCRDGSFIVLKYRIGAPLIPINRGKALYLHLSPPTFISASPNINLIAIATKDGLFFIRNMGANINKIAGKNLGSFITRNLEVYVRANALNALISLNSSNNIVIRSLHAVFRNVPPGNHELLITPTNPFIPRVMVNLSVEGLKTSFRISFLNPFTGKPIRFSIERVAGNKSIVLASNATTFTITVLNESYEAKYVVNFLPIRIERYEFSVYTNATIFIRIDYNSIYLKFSLPTWKRASKIELCIITPYGTTISNASIYIRGLITNYTTKLMFNPVSKCFEADSVPYDIYRVEYVRLPPMLKAPHEHTIVVTQKVVVSRQIALFKPVTLRIVFTHPPKVPLELTIGGHSITIEKGQQEVVLRGIEPGIYTIKIVPKKYISTFEGKLKVPYYRNVSRRIRIFENTSLRVSLTPACIYITINVLDSLKRGSGPIIPVRLFVNGVFIKTLTSKDHAVSGFVPISKVTKITIVPIQQVYDKVVKEIIPWKQSLPNGSKITIYLRRKMVRVTIIVMSNLGKRVSGALVIPTCEYGSPSPTVTDSEGKALFEVPAYTRCTIKIIKEGYEQLVKPLFVGTSAIYETIVIKAKPLTVVMQYINIILAGSMIGAIIGAILYAKKRIEMKLASTGEEIF